MQAFKEQQAHHLRWDLSATSIAAKSRVHADDLEDLDDLEGFLGLAADLVSAESVIIAKALSRLFSEEARWPVVRATSQAAERVQRIRHVIIERCPQKNFHCKLANSL